MAPRRPLQQKSQSSDQWGQSPAATATLRLGTNILIGLKTCWASHVWPHNTMDLPENIINIINDHLQFAFVV